MMVNRLIDARNRFSQPNLRADSQPASKAETEASQRERNARLSKDARVLREHLGKPARLPAEDRRAIARNLGRVIERAPGEKPTSTLRQFLYEAFSHDEAASFEKKRKRYFRFDGEQMDGEFAATGSTFLRISEQLADFRNPELDVEIRRDQMLVGICEGTSFFGPARPRLKANVPLVEKFRSVMQELTDRIARETDVISYFDEVRDFSIITHPYSLGDCDKATLANLHKQTLPIERFEHAPGADDDTGYGEYRRLRLAGFDIRTEAPSSLYPRMRIARVYVPRPVLCLPASVPTADLVELRTRDLTAVELKDALRIYEPLPTLDECDDDIERHAIRCWRHRREHEMWRAAIREAGFDPDNMDWHGFEDGPTGKALCGAEWRTFWQAMNVDMHLVADGRPDALLLGLSFSSFTLPHWTDAQKDLVQPADDDTVKGYGGNFMLFDESTGLVPWFECRDQSYVSRGFLHTYDSEAVVGTDDDLESDPWPALADDGYDEADFEPALPDYVDGLEESPLWPLQAPKPWQILTMQMKDWRAHYYPFGARYRPDDVLPSFRPLFDAQKRWTQAPDGSIAAAILSSLAYADGPERLDEKFIGEVNKLVGCFRDMKEGLSADLDEALAKHGYLTDH